ncbi:MAG: tyrosine-type recombinase/integrase [Planctomycetales bacterium]|nr:tyrosine-type recombinase/integrase [Planctomycetales bacterium]
MNEIAIIPKTDQPLTHGADSDDRLIDLWLHGRSRATQRAYRAAAKRFQSHVPKSLQSVTLADLQAYADSLEFPLQPASRKLLLAAIKSWISFAHRLGYLPFDVAKPLRLPPLKDCLAERIIDETLVLRMIALEPNPRNAAILALFYGGGLRVSELVGLKWRDVQERNEGCGQVTVLGKGGKTRAVLLSAGVFGRVSSLRNGSCDDAPVFRSRKRGHLHPGHVLRLTKAAAKKAGVKRNVRNHDLRHCHASHSLERGAPISLVQATLGHSSISTTGRYLHARPNDSSGRYLPL